MTTEALTHPTAISPRSAAPWAALPVTIAGAFMVVLDFFIGNVALPSIAADLHAGATQLEWIVASYGLAVAAFLITSGRLGDNRGRRRVYVAGLALFTVASIGCGVAPSAGALIAARVGQGIAGALVMPQVLAIIGVSFSGEARAKAMGIYSMSLGLAAIGGQLIGGALVHLDIAGLGWRSCFLVNVPIGVVAIALATRVVPESRAAAHRPLDLGGVALVTASVVAFTLPLIEGRAHGWPLWTWLSFAAVAPLATAFVARQRALARRGGAPLLDLALFSHRAFSAGLVTQLLFWCGQAAFFVYLALYLQPGRGLDALDAGLVFTIVAVTYVASSGAAPALAARHGRRVPLVGGLTLALGHACMAIAVGVIGTGGSVAWLAPGLALIGAGMGLCFTSLNAVVLDTLDGESAGSASGMMATVQELGNALGVAISGVIFFGALHHGFGGAFERSALEFVAIGLLIALLTGLLPGRPAVLDRR